MTLEPAPAGRTAGDPPLEILHADVHCVVALKPSGLPSVPGRPEHLRDCLHARLQQRYEDAAIVHRLDMATSGLIVFARGAEAQRRLSRSFAERCVVKDYVAVVEGRVDHDDGTIDLPLLADWPNRPRQKVDREHGKPSLTGYRVLARDAAGSTTRVLLRPVTGRAHQLRVHMLALGHPILGDALYAPPPVQARGARLLLHAAGLEFPHPMTGRPLRFEAPAPF